MASAKPTSREEEVLGGEQVPVSSTGCEVDSGRDEGMQSDEGEESTDVSESSDFDDKQDRLQGLDTMCVTDSLLEHSGSQDLL